MNVSSIELSGEDETDINCSRACCKSCCKASLPTLIPTIAISSILIGVSAGAYYWFSSSVIPGLEGHMTRQIVSAASLISQEITKGIETAVSGASEETVAALAKVVDQVVLNAFTNLTSTIADSCRPELPLP